MVAIVSKVVDWWDEIYLRFFNRTPIKFDPPPFYPLMIPVGDAIITWSESGHIDGDYSYFSHFVKTFNHEQYDWKDKIIFALILHLWKEQNAYEEEHFENIPQSYRNESGSPIRQKIGGLVKAKLPSKNSNDKSELNIKSGNQMLNIKYNNF